MTQTAVGDDLGDEEEESSRGCAADDEHGEPVRRTWADVRVGDDHFLDSDREPLVGPPRRRRRRRAWFLWDNVDWNRVRSFFLACIPWNRSSPRRSFRRHHRR